MADVMMALSPLTVQCAGGMHELWTTIVAPVLDAVRPGQVLDVGGEDERLAKLAAGFVESWQGSVRSWRWQPGGKLPPGEAEVVLLHRGEESWPVGELLDAIVAAGEQRGRPLPVVLVHGVEQDEEMLAAARRFAESRELLVVPGLGGVAIVTEPPAARYLQGRLGKLLEELSLSRAAVRHLAAIEDRRLAERARAERAWARLATAQERALEHETLLAERDELRARVRELAGAGLAGAKPPASESAAPALPVEPTQADVRRLLSPAELMAELGWQGAEEDLGRSIPNNVMAEDQRLEWEWTAAASQRTPPSIAYLLPGPPSKGLGDSSPPMPEACGCEGSAGLRSLVLEARGLRALGAATHMCLPIDALAWAERLHGNEDGLFVTYAGPDTIAQAVGAATVVVSTEHSTVGLAERIARERPKVVCAYYVRDYEPLLAPPSSAGADRALLSYRALPEQVLFAETHWLRNIVMARHGVPVMKVVPSLDTSLFHPRGRPEREGQVCVAAMICPHTPHRRAHATLRVLEEIALRLGDGVRALTFGCDEETFARLRASARRDGAPQASSGAGSRTGANDPAAAVEHLGLLSSPEVAEAMRRTDVFIDVSAYRALARAGLEAMACGAVPVLPVLGGVGEYATHDRDAVLLERDSPEAVAEAVCALLGDRERLARLRAAGLRSAARFSIERAARSQLGLFAAITTAGAQRATVPA
jgi:glycosyltransferase involved in cell wall biosynthesis